MAVSPPPPSPNKCGTMHVAWLPTVTKPYIHVQLTLISQPLDPTNLDTIKPASVTLLHELWWYTVSSFGHNIADADGILSSSN